MYVFPYKAKGKQVSWEVESVQASNDRNFIDGTPWDSLVGIGWPR